MRGFSCARGHRGRKRLGFAAPWAQQGGRGKLTLRRSGREHEGEAAGRCALGCRSRLVWTATRPRLRPSSTPPPASTQ